MTPPWFHTMVVSFVSLEVDCERGRQCTIEVDLWGRRFEWVGLRLGGGYEGIGRGIGKGLGGVGKRKAIWEVENILWNSPSCLTRPHTIKRQCNVLGFPTLVTPLPLLFNTSHCTRQLIWEHSTAAGVPEESALSLLSLSGVKCVAWR